MSSLSLSSFVIISSFIQLLNSRHALDKVLHFDVSTMYILVALLHPNFENAGDAHDCSDLRNDDRVEDIPVDGQLQLVVKHHDSERVAEEYENVIVHLELLSDVESDQLSCLDAGSSNNFVAVVHKLISHLVQILVRLAHLHD